MEDYISDKDLKTLREEYPVGCEIVLDFMDDEHAPLPGTIGKIVAIDDLGTIFCAWETGGSLGLIYGIDKYHKL